MSSVQGAATLPDGRAVTPCSPPGQGPEGGGPALTLAPTILSGVPAAQPRPPPTPPTPRAPAPASPPHAALLQGAASATVPYDLCRTCSVMYGSMEGRGGLHVQVQRQAAQGDALLLNHRAACEGVARRRAGRGGEGRGRVGGGHGVRCGPAPTAWRCEWRVGGMLGVQRLGFNARASSLFVVVGQATEQHAEGHGGLGRPCTATAQRRSECVRMASFPCMSTVRACLDRFRPLAAAQAHLKQKRNSAQRVPPGWPSPGAARLPAPGEPAAAACCCNSRSQARQVRMGSTRVGGSEKAMPRHLCGSLPSNKAPLSVPWQKHRKQHGA